MDPGLAKIHGRDSLAKIAEECGFTKQASSKGLLQLGDALEIGAGLEKRQFTRNVYRRAQHRLVAAGKHANFTRKANKQKG
jgi:hypothetical protein